MPGKWNPVMFILVQYNFGIRSVCFIIWLCLHSWGSLCFADYRVDTALGGEGLGATEIGPPGGIQRRDGLTVPVCVLDFSHWKNTILQDLKCRWKETSVVGDKNPTETSML